jgi:NADPH-dependent curcumin reductase CurA
MFLCNNRTEAAGAVGAIDEQIGEIMGCRIIGIAGSDVRQ